MANPVRTRSEVEQEVVRLRAVKSFVPHKTMFGDDNWEAIEAQTRVLNENMDREEIYTEWPDEDQLSILDSALEADEWAQGESDDSPSSGWQGLVE